MSSIHEDIAKPNRLKSRVLRQFFVPQLLSEFFGMLFSSSSRAVHAACFFFICCSSVHNVAMADVWKVVDKNGVIQFTNEPPGKNGQLVIASNSSGRSQTLALAKSNPSDVSAQTTVAIINALPAYQAVHRSLSNASLSYGVDYDLIKAVVATESAFNSTAVSPKGAVGLMQIMPDTAQRYGVQSDRGATVTSKLTDPDLNIQTGTRYLADLLRLFDGQTELALAAYNAGETAVARAGNRIPNFKETQAYVRKVMSVYQLLQTRAG